VLPERTHEFTHPSAGADPRQPGWVHACRQRLGAQVGLKALGITAFMALFFVAYFHLLRHPARPVTVMPLTALDHAIPFQPAAYAAYVSLWFYVCLAPGLLHTRRDLLAYALWAAALCLAGLACFYFVPTAVPPRPADAGAQHPALALLQGVDAAGNACPSLHVATAVFSAIWIDRLLRGIAAPPVLRAANGAWLALIAYSTLAIRQHVAIDVLAGAALGTVFGWASLRACARAALPQGGGR
jgi:membrane-associated phospholipid phosphatase